MSSRKCSLSKRAALVFVGGFLLAGIGTTCGSFTAESAFSAADTAFIFDCDTAFGGVFELSQLFIDCGPTGP